MASTDALENARELLKQQDEVLRRLANAPKLIGTVVQAKGDRMRVAVGGDILDVERANFAMVGDTVTLIEETKQIYESLGLQATGTVSVVKQQFSPTLIEIEGDASPLIIPCVKGTYEPGDRVLCDPYRLVAVKVLKDATPKFKTHEAVVSWDDIGGLHDAKAALIEAVELPYKHPKVFAFYGKRPPKGVLLAGPPGCGKTMLGKAVATSLSKTFGTDGSGFIYVKGPEILDRYVGVAEQTIRELFATARRFKEQTGHPAVLFIDEADAIMARRGSGVSSDMEKTIVPSFLTEIDGLDESSALVVLATNRADILDPAIVRDGRIDRKITVSRPTKEASRDILHLNLKSIPVVKGHDRLAEAGVDELFSDKRPLYRVALKDKTSVNVYLRHVVNGALVANIADNATSIALKRDLTLKTPQGLRKEDVVAAVNAVHEQHRTITHVDEIHEVVGDPERIERVYKVA